MSRIVDHPGLTGTETAWEGWHDGQVIVQDVCPDHCDNGLLYQPARFCGRCGGHGVVVVRTETHAPDLLTVEIPMRGFDDA